MLGIVFLSMYKACSKRRILHVPNAFKTLDNQQSWNAANASLETIRHCPLPFWMHSTHVKCDVWNRLYIWYLVKTLLRISLIWAFFLPSERRSTVDVRRRPGYKILRLFKFEFSEVNLEWQKYWWKLEKAPNFVTRPVSNVDRRTPFGSEKKCGMHISVKCLVNTLLKSQSFQSFMHEINNIEMVECMVFGKRAKNSRCIHALHVNKTFNTYRARLQKLANKVFFS
jgi:hypothetical protein